MRYYPPSLSFLLTELQKLPGVGPKTAQRLAFHLLRESGEEARRLGTAIATIHDAVTHCRICGNITERTEDPCAICTNAARDRTLLCLVEDADDIPAIEKTGVFKGLYHVLGGVLSALNHVRPEDLRIAELMDRLEPGEIREIIFALNPNVEGNATVTYLLRRIQPFHLRTTQIAYGIPVGSDLDYVDEVTLSRAMEGRRDVQ